MPAAGCPPGKVTVPLTGVVRTHRATSGGSGVCSRNRGGSSRWYSLERVRNGVPSLRSVGIQSNVTTPSSFVRCRWEELEKLLAEVRDSQYSALELMKVWTKSMENERTSLIATSS